MAPRVLVAFPLLVAAVICLEPLPCAGEMMEIGFSERLGLRDIQLKGQRVSRLVEFFYEPGTRPAPGSSLHLVFEHSPDLDGERSFLAVSLNHGALRSLRLDRRDGTSGELTIALPEGMLRPFNELVFAVEQAAPDEPRTWTRILARSSVSLAYERTSLAWTLADLPAPLLHRRSYGPRRLTILLPREPSPATVEAMALAVADLCRRVAPEPVSLAFVQALSQAASPVLAVGTPREQPELRGLRLAPQARVLPREGGAAVVARDGRPLSAGAGVVALVPQAAGGGQPLLAITGNAPVAVMHAARGLADVSRPGAGLVHVVSDPLVRSTIEPRSWTGFAPPRSRFRLDEVGDDQADLAVTRDTPARVRIRATPDARFLRYGNALKLIFRGLPALAEDPDAALEVYWNDTLLTQAAVRPLARGPSFYVSTRIPFDALRLDNVLSVGWNGRSGAAGPFVMLQSESELSLPREFVAQLPDLALLRWSFYPISLHADLADTIVVPPGGAGEDGLAALCELSAILGQRLPADRLAFRVVPMAELGRQRAAVNLILLETTQSPAMPELRLPDLRRLPGGEALQRLPMLEARVSPWNEQKHVLRLRAASPGLLRAAVRSLSRPAFLERLSGDTAFLAAEGPQCFKLATQRTLAEVSYLTRLDAWLRDNWIALPAILALVSGFLFMGLRLAIEQRRGAGAGPRHPARTSG